MLNITEIKDIVAIGAGIFGIIAGISAAVWAYVQFVIDRGVIPRINFDIDLNKVGAQGDKMVLEILLALRNVGQSALVCRSLWIDVLYITEGKNGEDPEKKNIVLIDNPKKKILCGHLDFPHSIKQDLKKESLETARGAAQIPKFIEKDPTREVRGLPVIRQKTYIQVLNRHSPILPLFLIIPLLFSSGPDLSTT